VKRPATRSETPSQKVSGIGFATCWTPPHPEGLGNAGRSADYKSAIQQIANLRYALLSPKSRTPL
jgi:hypothetical protein